MNTLWILDRSDGLKTLSFELVRRLIDKKTGPTRAVDACPIHRPKF